MKKNKCALCQQLKPKRFCKIKDNAFICPKCCAEIRDSSCAGCPHYTQAEKYAIEKMKQSKAQPFMIEINPELEDEVDNALEYAEKGLFNKAEELLRDLLKEHPSYHTVHYGMGVLMVLQDKHAESIRYFDKATEIFPYFVEAWYNKGSSHMREGELSGGLRAYLKVAEYGTPKDSFVKHAKEVLQNAEESIHEDTGLSLELYLQSENDFQTAFEHMEKGNYQEAIAGYLEVERVNPTNVTVLGNIGISHAHLGNKEKALQFLDKALSIDPTYQPAIYNKELLKDLEDGEKLPKMVTIDYSKELLKEKMRKELE